MKRGRLAVAMSVVAISAALLVATQAQAQVAPFAILTPNHGPVGTVFQVSINDNGTVFQCNSRGDTAQFIWDQPNMSFPRFTNITVPTGSFIGSHTKLQVRCTRVTGLTYNLQGIFNVEQPATTTTTTRPTTTTTTTRPATTTTTTRPGQTTTSTTSTSTTSSTVADSSTTTSLPPTTVTIPGGKGVRLDRPAAPPGGDANANGEGCDSGAPVNLSIDGDSVGHTVADAKGKFLASLVLPDLPVGRYTLTAKCGPTLTTDIDIVLASALGPPSGTLALLMFFLLIGFALVRRQIARDLDRKYDNKV